MTVKLSSGVLTLGDPKPQPEKFSIVMDCFGKTGFVGRRLREFKTPAQIAKGFYLHKNPAKLPNSITGIF